MSLLNLSVIPVLIERYPHHNLSSQLAVIDTLLLVFIREGKGWDPPKDSVEKFTVLQPADRQMASVSRLLMMIVFANTYFSLNITMI